MRFKLSVMLKPDIRSLQTGDVRMWDLPLAGGLRGNEPAVGDVCPGRG